MKIEQRLSTLHTRLRNLALLDPGEDRAFPQIAVATDSAEPCFVSDFGVRLDPFPHLDVDRPRQRSFSNAAKPPASATLSHRGRRGQGHRTAFVQVGVPSGRDIVVSSSNGFHP